MGKYWDGTIWRNSDGSARSSKAQTVNKDGSVTINYGNGSTKTIGSDYTAPSSSSSYEDAKKISDSNRKAGYITEDDGSVYKIGSNGIADKVKDADPNYYNAYKTAKAIADANTTQQPTTTTNTWNDTNLDKFYNKFGGGYTVDETLSWAENAKLANEYNSDESQRESARSAYSAKLKQIQNEEDQAKLNTEQANRIAYINNMLAQRNLAQQLQAQGINGGATESARLRLASGFQNNLNLNNMNLAQSLAQLGLQKTNSYADYQNQLANIDRDIANRTYENQQTKTTTPTLDELLKTRSSLLAQGLPTTYIDAQLNSLYPTYFNEETYAQVNEPVTEASSQEDNFKTYKKDISTAYAMGNISKQEIVANLQSSLASGEINEKQYQKLLTYLNNVFNGVM